MNEIMNQLDATPPQHGILHRCFFGVSGLRAGWRLLTFAVLFITFVVVTSIVACILVPALRSHRTAPLLIIAQEGLSFLCLLLAGWIMAKIEGRRVGDYGLPWRRMFCSQFWLGIVIGFASVSLLLFGMQALGMVDFGNISLHDADIWIYGGCYALAFLMVGLFEEFFSFGYALFTLVTGIGFWTAAILSSALFALLHLGNSGETWLGVLNVGLTGMLSCLILRRTGNLWMAVGYHAAWDWGESYFFGVADSGRMVEGHLFSTSISGPAWLSGGSVGPEGSVLCTVLLVTLSLLIAWLFPTAKFPVECDAPEPPNTALDSTIAIFEVSTEANCPLAVKQFAALAGLWGGHNVPRR
jgi:membrane protease YdiL (CAAX protease family)